MPISHISKFYATKDAKIAKLTADPAGGSATYASVIDVPGIKGVTIGGTINTKELHGDHQLLDTDSVLQNITVHFEYAKINLDALAVMLGGTVSDSGTTPNQIAKLAVLGTDNLLANQFKFESQIFATDVVGGDAHMVLYKCRLTSFPGLGTPEDDYETFIAEAAAVPLISTSKWADIVLNETATAIV